MNHIRNQKIYICGYQAIVGSILVKKANALGYKGDIENSLSKPDAAPQKLMSLSILIETGWVTIIYLEAGLKLAYSDFLEKTQEGKVRVA